MQEYHYYEFVISYIIIFYVCRKLLFLLTYSKFIFSI